MDIYGLLDIEVWLRFFFFRRGLDLWFWVLERGDDAKGPLWLDIDVLMYIYI